MNLTSTPNRLINEKSPYLLQHAHNPVDWYPWGNEAFNKAKVEDKPIFLSIGYSCCHWCHVMEKESFENEEVAKILNNNFVSIKVDREERPDIDSIYMRVCQVLTGSGGWPLTIIMTPNQKPFFAGTYFPRNDKNGMTGLVSILKYVEENWKNDKTKLLEAGNHILNIINESNTSSENDIFQDIPQKSFLRFRQNFDSSYGGFGTQPKFPSPHNLMFLISYWYKTGDLLSLKMVNKTLDCMEMGGIYDHIGYGFSRYSVDRKWLVPHFEKMLYDNALLSITYLMASKASGNKKYSTTAENILTYILRDMTSKEGGFYSAEDADSEGEEGKFYTWSADEIISVLGKDYGNKFCSYFNITPQGNFHGKNIPNLIRSSTENIEDMEFINVCREKLFKYRENRIHPLKDDKILTSWNGLMITAMSMAGRFLNDNKYIVAAENAVDFIYKKLIREDGRLLSRYRDGESSFPGYADDYAFLILGLIELYETTYNPNYLKMAVDLNEDLLKFFWDEKDGGFFLYGSDSEQLIMRPKEIYDGAIPSANSVSALNFLKLYHLTGNYKFQEMAEQIFRCFASEINSSPISYSFSLFAFQFSQSQTRQIIVVSDSTVEETKKVMDIINEKSNPFTISLLYFNSNKILENVCPSIKDYKTIDGKITVYICENFVCKKPITDIDLLSKIL